jgi:hypothetical protein
MSFFDDQNNSPAADKPEFTRTRSNPAREIIGKFVAMMSPSSRAVPRRRGRRRYNNE